MKENINSSINYKPIDFLNSQIDIFCHATENKEKIVGSLFNVLLIPQDKLNETEFEGHWGNKIIKISMLLNKKESSALVTRILKEINFTDRELLLSNLENHIDEKGNLFLRLDKQKLCKNKLFLTENEGIKIKFKPNKNKIIQQKRSNRIEEEIYNSYRRLIQFTEK